jgi:hypothetical protein
MESSAATQPRARATFKEGVPHSPGGNRWRRRALFAPRGRRSVGEVLLGRFRVDLRVGELLGRVEQAVADVAEDHVDPAELWEAVGYAPALRHDEQYTALRLAQPDPLANSGSSPVTRRPSPVGRLAESRFSSEDGSEVFDSAIRHSLDVLGRQTLCARRRPDTDAG